MANYSGCTRTNYFRVTDIEKYNKIVNSILCSEDSIHKFEIEEDGVRLSGCGAYDDISGVCDCEHCQEVELGNAEYDENECEYEIDFDKMCELLQGVVHPEDAIIITSVGNEKLRYVGGCSTIITKEEIKHVDLWSSSIESAREILKNDKYNTSYSC